MFSIERVYQTVSEHLPKDIQTQDFICAHTSSGILNRLRDAWAARKSQADVNHVTGDIHYLTYFLSRKRTILTFHDFGSVTHAHGLRKWLLWLFWVYLPVKKSAELITISEATRKELLKLVKVDPNHIHVIHNPLTLAAVEKRTPFNAKRPQILQIGTKSNKNFYRHVEALREIPCEMVIVGQLDDQQKQTLSTKNIQFTHHENVSDAKIQEIYEDADILLFSSLVEGFGLPILEAQAAGVPVITSNLLSMPEVAGDGALLVNPENVDEIRRSVEKIINDADLRANLVAKGKKNISRFDPQIVAEKYATLYRKVLQSAID
ncbi:MAG: glycosyltransferase family 1 protein [Lentilitoribacter sp.]